MRVCLTNLGCKLNQAEIEAIGRRLVADGHQVVPTVEAADLHLVNSCTVTAGAARSSRKTARRASRIGGRVRTVLTGCYVSGSPQEAASVAGVDLVIPNDQKDELVDRLYDRFPEWRPTAWSTVPVPYVPLRYGTSRALVKIEDGCNMSCSFCIIPQTRGRQVSRPAEAIVDQVGRLATGGFREVVITGVQISSYRWRRERLVTLVDRLLAETPIERLRLTSIAPWDFDLALLDLVDSGRVCRHFHLSLQSGCDRTLGAMRRPYDTTAFATLVETIRQRFPEIAITTDVIVGFPGETETDWQQSLEFVRRIGFSRIHAFPYSPRPGTSAASMSGQVDAATRRQRMATMLDLAKRSERAFRHRQLGTTLPVLWEYRRDGVWHGTSDNYLKVNSGASRDLRFSVTPTLIESMGDSVVMGRPLRAA